MTSSHKNSAKNDLPPKVEVVFADSKVSDFKADPYAGIELRAELFFRHIFGDKKYDHTASRFNDPVYFKKQIKKMISQFKQDIDNLQASEIFISSALNDLENLQSELLKNKFTKERQKLSLLILQPIANFLGYGAGSKHKTVEPYFIPSFWQEIRMLNNQEKFWEHPEMLRVDYRLQIVEQLSNQGLSKAYIAEIMNQSGYRIGQYLNAIKAKKEKKK